MRDPVAHVEITRADGLGTRGTPGIEAALEPHEQLVVVPLSSKSDAKTSFGSTASLSARPTGFERTFIVLLENGQPSEVWTDSEFARQPRPAMEALR